MSPDGSTVYAGAPPLLYDLGDGCYNKYGYHHGKCRIRPAGIAASPYNSTVYVVNWNDNTVSVINAATNTVTGTIPVGANPDGIAVSPDNSTLYVADRDDNNVSVINTATNSLITNVTLGSGTTPNGIAVTLTDPGYMCRTMAAVKSR